MFKHILIPTDGSALSEKAVKAGIDFAKVIGAKVTALCVIEELPPMYSEYVTISPGEWREGEDKWAKQSLGVVEGYAHSVKVPYEGRFVRAHTPYEAIIRAADENHCDLIFMASHGRRGLAGLVLGSQTTKVLTHCKVPVLVYR